MLDFSSFDKFVLDRLLEYQVDVIHVHDFPMLRAGVELARLRKVPLIYDAHELYYAQTQLPKATQRRYMRREHKWICHADRVITVNPYIAKLMEQKYSIDLPIVILNSAPLLPCVHENSLRKRFNLRHTTRIILYQGWISDNRGIDKLVLAARHFDEGIVLVIVGYGLYEETLHKIVRENNLESRVHFFGGVDSDKLHPITCDADLGVIPYFGVDENNYFCSPNKLFEFAIAELPFICNDLPFLHDIISQYGNGIIADLSEPLKIAMDINKVMRDRELLLRLRLGAIIAKQKLNWNVEELKLLAIYKSLFS
jgi:glycosyltransferase involved in cell wall biosynthesis